MKHLGIEFNEMERLAEKEVTNLGTNAAVIMRMVQWLVKQELERQDDRPDRLGGEE